LLALLCIINHSSTLFQYSMSKDRILSKLGKATPPGPDLQKDAWLFAWCAKPNSCHPWARSLEMDRKYKHGDRLRR
jgi:hypothetical protein